MMHNLHLIMQLPYHVGKTTSRSAECGGDSPKSALVLPEKKPSPVLDNARGRQPHPGAG